MRATHMEEIKLGLLLTTRVNTTQIFPQLWSGSLIYILKLWDYGWKFTFTETHLNVDKQGTTILEVHLN